MEYTEVIEVLEEHAEKGMGCGVDFPHGWTQLVYNLHRELVAIDPYYVIDQVKEKFGGLRVYLQYYLNQEVHDIISKYEIKSTKICCLSGKKATHRSTGWVRFYNEEHAPKGAIKLEN